jgi:tetratricopeptide (TPR) repeat protein
VVTDSYTLPVDVQVLGVYPHAHFLATVMEAYAELPGGARRQLLRIRDWDFNWQDEYRYADSILLPRGSTITMRFLYDNSAGNPQNPSRPPKRVTYGPNSTDEMGDLILQVLPGTAEDRDLLERDLSWKYAAQDAGWFADLELVRGTRLRLRGEYTQAIEHVRAALDNRADARAHAAMAAALADGGDLAQAWLHARAAVQAGPDDPFALAAMARLLAQHPDPAVRNPGEARMLAGRAERAMGGDDAMGLEAVAAAHAAAGARDRAARVMERAIAMANRAGDDSLTSALKARLEQYRRP